LKRQQLFQVVEAITDSPSVMQRSLKIITLLQQAVWFKHFSKVRSAFPDAFIEIEVDSISQLEEVAAQSPDLVLLDNMSPEECARAVAFVAGRFKLEASGGITLENARAYAESGVDYLAIGALTHSAPVLDIGLDLRLETRTEK
jgi:nicotinate-nucleotide pyrophosphorylase